jgi:hypothetical protein
MNHPSARGIRRHGVDATFAADETRKSTLMLEAQLLRAQQHFGAAAEKYATAAALEEHLRDVCFQQGLVDKAFVHGFSAASCWAQAGDLHHAIQLCAHLLARADVPDRLRTRIEAYVKTLDARRAQWYEELVLHDVGDDG